MNPDTTSRPIVAADGRRVVRVTGEDRHRFLDATLSQALADIPAATVRQALWLDVHAAPLAALDVVALGSGDALLLVVDAAGVPTITDVLANRTFLSDAVFTLEDSLVVAVRGTGLDVVGAGSVDEHDDVIIVGRRDGLDLIGQADAVHRWLRAHDLEVQGDDDALWDHEVRHGIPRFGIDLVAPHLPEEAGVLATHVHLAKGCYPGQEAVARMWMLGRPRRRLVVLDLDGPAEPGDEVGTGRDRLTVTRCTHGSPWAALAYAPAATEVGDDVVAPTWRGRVTAIVGAQLAQPGADPAVTQRRNRARGA